MGSVISVEGISKRYALSHEVRPRYLSLRDQVSQGLRRMGQRVIGTAAPRRTTEDFWALRGVSFEVEPGDTVAVIGRNGAGKSTLLKILSRVTDPTEGRVRLRGRVASLLEVGTGFHPELTGRENVFLNGSVLGLRRAEIRARFDEIVAFAEVERFLDTPVKHYSSGMYTRLAFAVAAHLEPEILVVDEVLAVGDAGFQQKCLGKMQDVSSRDGRTVLFVSHNMGAIQALCRKTVWLQDGTVRRIGPTADVVSEYLNTHTEGVPQVQWDDLTQAPGDDRVRLRAARLIQDGQLASVVDINRPVEVELEFQACRFLKNLIVGVSFFDAAGTCLFASCDWRLNELEPGRYRQSARVRAFTFAEGPVGVFVQLVFLDPMVQSVVRPNTLSFEAVDSDVPGAVRGRYYGTWPGVVRLGLEWSLPERIER